MACSVKNAQVGEGLGRIDVGSVEPGQVITVSLMNGTISLFETSSVTVTSSAEEPVIGVLLGNDKDDLQSTDTDSLNRSSPGKAFSHKSYTSTDDFCQRKCHSEPSKMISPGLHDATK